MVDLKDNRMSVTIDYDPSGNDLELDEKFIDSQLRYNPNVTKRFLMLHFAITEEQLDKYFKFRWGCSFKQRKEYLFELTKSHVLMEQMKAIKNGSQAMMIHWGRNYCGQDQNNSNTNRPESLPLNYVPLSKRGLIEK